VQWQESQHRWQPKRALTFTMSPENITRIFEAIKVCPANLYPLPFHACRRGETGRSP